MYVIDGIAYAGEQKKPLSVISVRPLEGYKLFCRFNDGSAGVFDAQSLIETPAFAPLQEQAAFQRVYIDFGTLTWADGAVDIASEYVYAHTKFSEEERGA